MRAALEDENRRLREALQRLIVDYEDVPDPTDADGQQVFADARAALRQRADEATRRENEACAKLRGSISAGVPATTEQAKIFTQGFCLALDMYAAAIRARIAP